MSTLINLMDGQRISTESGKAYLKVNVYEATIEVYCKGCSRKPSL